MLTGMTADDWAVVLTVFDGVQSRRGEPGRDDRLFLEAVHYFTLHSITWRALPEQFEPWNSVWKRFWRLSRSGVFEAFLPVSGRVQPFCAPGADVRQHGGSGARLGGRKRGQQNQALGRSRGGFSCKIHLKTDFDGLPIGFHLTGGEVSDSTQ